MASLIEDYARRVKWSVRKHNVIVEGSSDVAMLMAAAKSHEQATGRGMLMADLAVLPAGYGQDGGATRVVEELMIARRIAERDCDADGKLRHHFIGLCDGDQPGREAVDNGCRAHKALLRCRHIFVLRPNMPKIHGLSRLEAQRLYEAANADFDGGRAEYFDWEIEDLLSQPFLETFIAAHPQAVQKTQSRSGRVHRKLTRAGKTEFVRQVQSVARIADLQGLIDLLLVLRDHAGLPAI